MSKKSKHGHPPIGWPLQMQDLSDQQQLSRYTQQYSGHTYIEVLQLLHDVCVGYLSGCWVVCCQAWGSLKHMACSIPSMG